MSEASVPGGQKPEHPQPALSDEERAQIQRLLSFPLELPSDFVSFLEQRMMLLMEADNVLGLAQRIATVGEYKAIAKDLTAETGLYVYEDTQGAWLYCNGQTFSATAYPELNTFLGGTTLPDCRGRSAWFCGTNAACDLLDNDGVTESSRQPKHTHTDNISAGGTFVTGVSVTSGAHTVTTGGPSNVSVYPVTLSTTTASPSNSGSVGSGMSGSDAVAHVFIGSLLIKCD